MKVNSLFYLCLITYLSSCSLSKNSNDNARFDTNSGTYFKKVKEFEFSLKPYYINKLASDNYKADFDTISNSDKAKIIDDYNDFVCFLFEISIDGFNGEIQDYNNSGTESEYEKIVNYYLFKMQDDIVMKGENGIEYPCVIFYHERIGELSKSNRFIVGFKRPNVDDVTFQYNNQFINCGTIKFMIDKKHLIRV